MRLRSIIVCSVALLVFFGCSTLGSAPPGSAKKSPALPEQKGLAETAPRLSAARPSSGQTGAASTGEQAPLKPKNQTQEKAPKALAPKSDKSPAVQPNGANGDCVIEDDEDDNGAANLQSPEATLARALALCRLSQLYWQRGDLEKAIEALDDAYALILDVETENDPKLLQEKEDLRFSISKRILEIYSSRHVAVNGSRNEIPITVNQHVQEEIVSFTVGRERDFFLESYRRSGKYRPKIEAALKEAGLPAELSWLPLIESGYKVTALSPARALGLWQFIPSTGYRYGLNRDNFIDERLDPEKATRAAIEYLKELHGMFGDWTTVLAAYNCGENRVLRTIQSQNINYLDNFWDLYERLPRETARYVPRFLATLEIIHSPAKYGLNEPLLETALDYETVTVPRQADLKAIAQVTGIEEATLRELNSELRQGTLPTEGYDLRVPQGTGDIVLAKLDEVPIYRPNARMAMIRHRVRRGETLEGIAQKYGSDPKSILVANNIRLSSQITSGKVIRVPQNGCQPESPPPSRVVKASIAGRETIEHVVQRGDSLWNIAKRYGTTAQKIQQQNQVSSQNLTLGQVLKINPPPAAEARSEPLKSRPRVYSVRKGDTLYVIAQQHNLPVEKLLALNRLTVRSKLQPGQKIIVE